MNSSVLGGFQNAAIGESSFAAGSNNVATGKNAGALGNGSYAAGANSMAIGNEAYAGEDNTISFGHKKGDPDASSLIISQKLDDDGNPVLDENGDPVTEIMAGDTYQTDSFSRLTNIANGTDTHDAATVGQVQEAAQQNAAAIQQNSNAIQQNASAIQQNSNAITSLNTHVRSLGQEIDSVGALSAALAGLHPIDYDGSGSRFQISAAAGTYDGKQAVSLGGFYHVNRDVMLSLGASSTFGNDRKAAGNFGVTFRVGPGASQPVSQSSGDIESLKAEVEALKAEIQALKAR